MAVNTTGITPAAVLLPTIWPSEVSDAVQANTVLGGLVDRSFESEMKFGRILTIQDFSNPGVRIKTQDSTATWANITETQQTLTISLQAYVAFLVEDIAEIQAKVDIRQKYTDNAGYSLAAFVEGDATSGLASLPNSFSNLVGTLGIDPVLDDLNSAKSFLDKYDVPAEDRFIYVSPGYHNALLKIEQFVRSDFGADANVLKKGKVGRIYNADVYVSTLTANNPNVTGQAYGWFCHKRGVALVMQRKPTMHEQYIMLETGMGVLVDTIYNFLERLIAPKTLGGGTSTDQFNVGLRGPS